ncbi:GNAT family N-acetyltransferase, partial [Cronobacter sakazakii]|nr:GNAT family N-acetyltransferase [Cronobacter sakazakii]
MQNKGQDGANHNRLSQSMRTGFFFLHPPP